MTKHWTALAVTGNLTLVNQEDRLFNVLISIDVNLVTNKPRRYQPGALLKTMENQYEMANPSSI